MNCSDTTSSMIALPGTLDTEEIKAELQKAEDIAGNDETLQFTQRQQCKMITGETFDSKALVEPVRLFDNLYYFGNQETGVFVFTTDQGYIMIDSGFYHMAKETIIPGMEKLGLDPAQVRYILITHAGPDHCGGAYYFQQTYGTRVVMSKEEWTRVPSSEENAARYAARQQPDYEYNPFDMRTMPFPNEDIVGTDGMKITLGNFTITIVETPRRTTGGGLSYLAPVYEYGEKHMWATYGNTNVIGSLADMKVYRETIAHFLTYTDKLGVDVIISNHPFVDRSIPKMELLRSRAQGTPNPFIMGTEKVRAFLHLLDQSSAVIAARLAAGLSESGNEKLPAGVTEYSPIPTKAK